MSQLVENVKCPMCGAASRQQGIGIGNENYLVNCDGQPPGQYMISSTALNKLEGQPGEPKRLFCDAAHGKRAQGKVYWIHVDSNTGQVVGEVTNKLVQR